MSFCGPDDSWASNRLYRLFTGRAVVLGLNVLAILLTAECGRAATGWWSAAAEQALSNAGTNREQLVLALEQVSEAQREGMQFLVENMPRRDLESLSSAYLLENVSLAYKAFDEAPWSKSIPREIFLNDVLPYASVNESRDDWRQRLYDLSLPLVQGCKTAGEAAQALNQKLFPLVKVKYSTQRRRADQGPLETMESGMATCTGLSILLVDACRSVGVPARVVGVPTWTTVRGNHTWVEIWDGDWHFMGAAEPDPNGLDRGWFVHNASLAIKDEPDYAIYASSFKKTGLNFLISWAYSVDYVSAVNVTDRYAKPGAAEAAKTRLLVNVLDRPAGKRVASEVKVIDMGGLREVGAGTSKEEPADMNDHLGIEVEKNRTYLVRAERDGKERHQSFTTGKRPQETLALYLSGNPVEPRRPERAYVAPAIVRTLPADEEARLKAALTEYFTAPAFRQESWQFQTEWDRLLRKNEPAVRRAAWEAYCAAPIHGELRADYDTHRARFGEHVSPYTVKTVGTRPPGGWAFFIAMHGGGNAPQALNDSQWRVMQSYYRDHPEVGGYVYVALRAPDNTWNGFYTSYIYPLVANLIRQFKLFGDVDPNKVFVMGYSHGGYGAFAIGPKMPDYFAAAHASAGAPADGAVPQTLRNSVFTFMVGSEDTAYGRIERNKEFAAAIEKLRGDRTDIYPVTFQLIQGNGHTGLPDRDKIAEMYEAVRNPIPRELTWGMSDNVIQDFFWLHTPSPAAGMEIDAACRDNRLTVTATNGIPASILLDSRLVDFGKPVVLEINGKKGEVKLEPRLRVLCQTLQRRGDPELAFTAEIQLAPPPSKASP